MTHYSLIWRHPLCSPNFSRLSSYFLNLSIFSLSSTLPLYPLLLYPPPFFFPIPHFFSFFLYPYLLCLTLLPSPLPSSPLLLLNFIFFTFSTISSYFYPSFPSTLLLFSYSSPSLIFTISLLLFLLLPLPSAPFFTSCYPSFPPSLSPSFCHLFPFSFFFSPQGRVIPAEGAAGQGVQRGGRGGQERQTAQRGSTYRTSRYETIRHATPCYAEWLYVIRHQVLHCDTTY